MIFHEDIVRLYLWKKNRHKLWKITVIGTITIFALILIIGFMSNTSALPLFCKEGYIQFRNECIPDEHENNFFDLMKSKAHVAFIIKLDKLGISPKHFTIQSGLKTDDKQEFFMAEVIADDDQRYFLTTIFYQDQPLDQINVEISKIISPECTQENILKGHGCNPKYLRPIE